MYSFRNVDLPIGTEIRSSLQAIKGIGWRKSIVITSKLGLPYPFFVGNLNFYNFSLLSHLLSNLVINDIKVQRKIRSTIVKLVDIKSYRGKRHSDCMPVRGQRTRTNARVRRRLKVRTMTLLKFYGWKKATS